MKYLIYTKSSYARSNLKKKGKKKKSMELEFLNAAIADQTKKKKAWNSGITYSYVFVVLSVAVGVPCIFFFF